MAFTDAQKLSISTILGITPTLLDAQITALGATLTAAKETAIIAELARWTASGAKFTKLHPRESNKGVETYPDQVKGDIRRNIATLLEMLEWGFGAAQGMGTMQIGL